MFLHFSSWWLRENAVTVKSSQNGSSNFFSQVIEGHKSASSTRTNAAKFRLNAENNWNFTDILHHCCCCCCCCCWCCCCCCHLRYWSKHLQTSSSSSFSFSCCCRRFSRSKLLKLLYLSITRLEKPTWISVLDSEAGADFAIASRARSHRRLLSAKSFFGNRKKLFFSSHSCSNTQ